MDVTYAPGARRALDDADLSSAVQDTITGAAGRAVVHRWDSLMRSMSRCARVLHPYSVDEAEELADRYVLDETRLAALEELRRLTYLAGA